MTDTQDTRTDWQKERDARDAEADEIRRLCFLGAEKVPGLRFGECEVAGRLWEMLQAGEIDQAGWENFVEQMKREGKVSE